MLSRLSHTYRHLQSVFRMRSGALARTLQTSEHRAMLMFHSILPKHDSQLHLRNSTIEELRTIIRFLQKTGAFVSVKQYIDEPEPHQYAITFDDGLYNNLRYAAPVLGELNIPASYYINTPWIHGESTIWTEELSFWTKHHNKPLRIGKSQYHKQAHNRWLNIETGQTLMSDLLLLKKEDAASRLEEIRKQTGSVDLPIEFRNLKGEEIRLLSEIPFTTIGSHGIDHHAMTLLSEDSLKDTLVTSKKYLQECTATAIDEIAFPFGMFNEAVYVASSLAGYEYMIGVEKNERFSDVAHRFGFYNHLSLPQQLGALSSYQ
ncbi:MAG: hypothetical protein RLZZ262_2347 [Bacteroidota bacterium]|jgi:peptidoglycan/xylan/chitin deacetylase (PgdA/CDA1 family)